MTTDAIVVLRNEHKEIKRLFRRFERTDDKAEQKRLVGEILEMLALHTGIENEVMYPRMRKLVPDIDSDILESYEEHHVADLLCAELAEMGPDDERFVAKTTVLIESVEHHIDEEEESWFPDVREKLGRKDLQEIGADMLAMREKLAKRPAARRASVQKAAGPTGIVPNGAPGKAAPAKSAPPAARKGAATRTVPPQSGRKTSDAPQPDSQPNGTTASARNGRKALTPPKKVVDALADGDPGLGGAMTELTGTNSAR